MPAPAVPAVAEECGTAGVRALVVLTSGLDAGRGAALLASCRRHDLRMVGPDRLGIAVNDEDIGLDATPAAHRPLPGTAGVPSYRRLTGGALASTLVFATRLDRLGIPFPLRDTPVPGPALTGRVREQFRSHGVTAH